MGDEPPAQGREIIRGSVVGLGRLRDRHAADAVLFAVTALELWLLVKLTPTFTPVDWIYVSSNVLMLAIALARRPPREQDRSLAAAAAVIISYAYPYAQVAVLRWLPGHEVAPRAGLVLVIAGACGSLIGLLSLGRSFGVRPALRRIATRGAYRVVRHPLYLSYVLADIGYNLQECSYATLALVAAGWASLAYRIAAEERVLSHDPSWPTYAARVRYRLLPGVW